MSSGPRRLALEVLMSTERDGAFADAALGRRLDSAELAEADRHLATLLVYGTLARRLTLDHTLAAYVARPLAKLDLRVRETLRLGLFQIAFLDRVPDYAAVDTSVALVKRGAPYAAGLVNAVLRRATREGLVDPPRGDETTRLSIEHSHPRWLVERLVDELGSSDAVGLMHANNEPMPNILRALVPRSEAIQRLATAGIDAHEARFAPEGLRTAAPVTLPGIVVPQGEASQLVALLLGASVGDRVLDACAAPGGKAAYLARQVGAGGRVVAVDPAPRATARIERLLAATKVANVDIAGCRIEDYRPTADGFDAVLVDAPCSGLGTAREHPEIRWRRTAEDVAELADRQRSVLAAAANHVRPGGTLVYATCTVLREENDDVIDDFLARNDCFVNDDTVPESLGAAAELCHGARLRTFPHRHDMAGFFAARLRRRDR